MPKHAAVNLKQMDKLFEFQLQRSKFDIRWCHRHVAKGKVPLPVPATLKCLLVYIHNRCLLTVDQITACFHKAILLVLKSPEVAASGYTDSGMTQHRP